MLKNSLVLGLVISAISILGISQITYAAEVWSVWTTVTEVNIGDQDTPTRVYTVDALPDGGNQARFDNTDPDINKALSLVLTSFTMGPSVQMSFLQETTTRYARRVRMRMVQ